MGRRFLLSLLFLLFGGLSALSAQYVSVSIEKIRELRTFQNLLLKQIKESEKEQKLTQEALTELDREYLDLKSRYWILVEDYQTLQSTNSDLLTSLKKQKEQQKEWEKSLKKSNLRTNFIVGGVCFIVGVGAGVGITVAIINSLNK